MKGYEHGIIWLCATIGFALGNSLIDLDHRPFNIACLWRGFWGSGNGCNISIHQGILHNPIVMLSIAAFAIMLGLGILFHIYGDFVFY